MTATPTIRRMMSTPMMEKRRVSFSPSGKYWRSQDIWQVFVLVIGKSLIFKTWAMVFGAILNLTQCLALAVTHFSFCLRSFPVTAGRPFCPCCEVAFNWRTTHLSVVLLLVLASRNGSKVLKPTACCSWPVAEKIKLEELDCYRFFKGEVEQGGSFVSCCVVQLIINQRLPRTALVCWTYFNVNPYELWKTQTNRTPEIFWWTSCSCTGGFLFPCSWSYIQQSALYSWPILWWSPGQLYFLFLPTSGWPDHPPLHHFHPRRRHCLLETDCCRLCYQPPLGSADPNHILKNI